MSSSPPLVQPFTDDSNMNAKASVLGFVIEPLVVISLLTVGVIFNRRPLSPVSRIHSPPISPAVIPTSHTRHHSLRFFKPRDTSRFANNWISSTLYRFPFLLEVLYWGLTYWVYQIARAISAALFIDDGTVDIARRHAIQLLEFERRIGIHWENKVQDTIMQHAWAITALNWCVEYEILIAVDKRLDQGILVHPHTSDNRLPGVFLPHAAVPRLCARAPHDGTREPARLRRLHALALHASALAARRIRLRRHGAQAWGRLRLDHEQILQPARRDAVPPLRLLTHRRRRPLRPPAPAPLRAPTSARAVPPLPSPHPPRHRRDSQPLPARRLRRPRSSCIRALR
jgi:hypothetical protein